MAGVGNCLTCGTRLKSGVCPKCTAGPPPAVVRAPGSNAIPGHEPVPTVAELAARGLAKDISRTSTPSYRISPEGQQLIYDTQRRNALRARGEMPRCDNCAAEGHHKDYDENGIPFYTCIEGAP